MEDILPHYLSIGVSKAEFMESCPAELRPYDAAYRKRTNEENFMLWLNGKYVADAILSTLGNSGWFKSKGTPDHHYPKEPYKLESARPLTQEEKRKAVDEFWAQESARRANWRRTHKKQE